MVSYTNQYDVYKKQNVMTASAGELTLMLYDGCIKNIKLGKLYIDENNIEKTSEALIKAQNIISELAQTLNMDFEISGQLLALYDFILRTISAANVAKDSSQLDIAIELVTDLRDTWQQVVKQTRHTGAGLTTATSNSCFSAAAE